MRFLAARTKIEEHLSQAAAAGFRNAARDRMPLAPHEFEEITDALQSWRQGDLILSSDLAFVHVARLSKPLTEGATLLADERPEVEGDSDFGTVTTEAPGGKQSDEGKHVDAIREIRVSDNPSWDADEVQLVFWFIKEHNPQPQNWHKLLSEWEGLIDKSGRFKTDEPFYIVDIDDITAKDYLESQRLDYDQLSAA
jgi:hypothetical protein